MSKSYRFELNKRGVLDLLQSDWAMEIVEAKANEVQARCGEGYEVTTHRGKGRCQASVHANTVKSRQENAQNNTLLKALR